MLSQHLTQYGEYYDITTYYRLQVIAETNMGNSYSGGSATDANEVLVHSFQLDTDHSMCSCPFLCAGRTVSS